jgi:hypothetical protein
MPIMFDVENEKPPVTVDGKSKMKPVESYEKNTDWILQHQVAVI